MDMDVPFASSMVLNTDQSKSPVKPDYIWPAFARNPAHLATLDVPSGRSLSTSGTSSPRFFSDQVSSGHEAVPCAFVSASWLGIFERLIPFALTETRSQRREPSLL